MINSPSGIYTTIVYISPSGIAGQKKFRIIAHRRASYIKSLIEKLVIMTFFHGRVLRVDGEGSIGIVFAIIATTQVTVHQQIAPCITSKLPPITSKLPNYD